jgi:hypothetical protein
MYNLQIFVVEDIFQNLGKAKNLGEILKLRHQVGNY